MSYKDSADQESKEVLFINIGSTKGTTFKIDVGGMVFSSPFDTGAQISCIMYDTVATLGLLSQISDNNVDLCIRATNGQDMGVLYLFQDHLQPLPVQT